MDLPLRSDLGPILPGLAPYVFDRDLSLMATTPAPVLG